jgi:hypothetical protein
MNDRPPRRFNRGDRVLSRYRYGAMTVLDCYWADGRRWCYTVLLDKPQAGDKALIAQYEFALSPADAVTLLGALA